jgi:hypothetical protein
MMRIRGSMGKKGVRLDYKIPRAVSVISNEIGVLVYKWS